MRVLGIVSTTAVFLLLGAAVPAFAQEEHQEESAKPAQHEEQPKPAPKQEQAKPQKQEQQAKPAKQEQAKPEKQQQQATPEKQEQQAKSQEANQQKHTQEQAKSRQQQETKQQQAETQQNEAKSQQHQQQTKGQAQESQGQYARNGQKDKYGHEYNESHFGPSHQTRFQENGGRYYNGRREYSYGGYWFYAGTYPGWFYQQDVYFVMGADGLWYAVASGNPSLTFQVNIG
jgi:hypothetical protein